MSGHWGWVGVAGAGLGVVGSVLPWATVSTGFGTASVAGTHGDGRLTLAAAVVSGAFLVHAFTAKALPAANGAAVFAAIGLVVAVMAMRNVSRAADGVVGADVGVGVYLCLVGFVLALIGALSVRSGLAQRKQPPAEHPEG